MSMTGTSNATVDARLAQLRDLQAQFDRVRERLRRAEEQKGTVTRRTYDKVRAEYDRELDTLRAQMTPLRDELESQRQTIEDAMKQANGSMEALEEELAEAVFRHRVGEFTDAELADKRRSIDARLDTARARMADQRRTLDMFAAMEEPSATPVDPADLAA
jgi:chromosome segregation ATPase